MRQERPPQLRPDGIHPAMRERGRAIPATTTVPIITEEKPIPSTAPRIVEGRVSRHYTILLDQPLIHLFYSLDPYQACGRHWEQVQIIKRIRKEIV